MSQFYKSHLTARKREMLVFGYVRSECNSMFIPVDITRLFLMMFGDNTIYYRISGDAYQFLISNEMSSQKYPLKSSSLKIHNIEFTLNITKKQSSFNAPIDIILSVSSTAAESDDQYVITRYTMYCEEYKYEYRKFTDNRNSEAVEWTEDFMAVNDIKQLGLKAINFVCKIEILHVYQKHDYNANIQDEMIEAYYSNIQMMNKINYNWLIYDKYIETKTHSLFEMVDLDDKKEDFKSYYSPYIDNDNWCVLFTESKTRFGVQLQLLSLPFGVVSIMVRWECCLYYQNKYKDKYEEIFEFGFEMDSVLSHGWNKKDIIDGFYILDDKDDETKEAERESYNIMINNEYAKDIMLEIKFEILVVKEYNENIVFRENWPLYGINIVDDIDIKDSKHTDGHIAIVTDFDEDNFSWNYMVSALNKRFEDKLNEQMMKYENEMNVLRNEINKLKMKGSGNVKYEVNDESAEEVNLWLCSIEMGMYFELFVENGFDSMKMVKQINDKYDLSDIGINTKAHQLTIMNAIDILKQ